MRTIALSLAAWIPFATVLAAADQTPFASLSRLATALSENDSDGALEYFDSGMKDFGRIESNIEALTAQADITCAIDIVTDSDSEGIHKLDVDWYMQLKSQGDAGQLERRRERVQLEMRQIKGVWKITALSPVAILDPLRLH